MRSAALLFFAFSLLGAFAGDVEAESARRGGARLVSNWHLGPFFEYRRAEPGDASFWAVRPFYSQVRDPATNTSAYDALWPLVTYRSHADTAWWRALIAWGDSRENTPEFTFNVFPFWFSGCDRKDEDYWGFFPFWGEHPHFLLMDDWSFCFWPIWHTYTVKGVRSHAVCWPFITWRDAPREGLGIWPFYGQARLRESQHGYALWPLVTWAAYDEDRDTSGAGYSWWMLPFYGEVRRARERQTMVLPPFFSYAETKDGSKRWRLPWPFFEWLRSPVRDRLSIFPFWESIEGRSYAAGNNTDERTWRVGWQLIENTHLTSGGPRSRQTDEYRFNFFPFVTYERRTSAAGEDTYLRIWPFWSSETVKGRTRSRTLELMPIRHSEGIERNWAPYWSLWEKDERPDGRTRYSLLFNFISWQTDSR